MVCTHTEPYYKNGEKINLWENESRRFNPNVNTFWTDFSICPNFLFQQEICQNIREKKYAHRNTCAFLKCPQPFFMYLFIYFAFKNLIRILNGVTCILNILFSLDQIFQMVEKGTNLLKRMEISVAEAEKRTGKNAVNMQETYTVYLIETRLDTSL